ncbi:MAG: hypothetical protein IH600_01635 [Bacteroidetes bacterium]|nr:hypothetical protein [Bacteroidota bacterium]
MNILYICGTLNQTTQMHQIASHLPEYENHFTPYYGDYLIRWLSRHGFLEFTILGNKMRTRALAYMRQHNLNIDDHGIAHEYDLVLTCQDLIVPRNIRSRKLVLVQEGMTDPEGFAYHLVKHLRLPRYFASTSVTGLSDRYDYFCVASNGYRDLFIDKGVRPEKLVVTGIPNFDNCAQYLENDFPHRDYVLVATSDTRETFRYENRRKFIRQCVDIAAGRTLIFKLHPNENHARAAEEIKDEAPGALVYTEGNTNHMVANCAVLITRFSSVVYVGLALGKEVHSEFDMDELRAQVPIQNGGTSAKRIADMCRDFLERGNAPRTRLRTRPVRRSRFTPETWQRVSRLLFAERI